jgi:hypothetical protein
MECRNCKYLNFNFSKDNTSFFYCVCAITNRINPKPCNITNDEDVKGMDICYNCQHWIGGGDWGLSCAKKYYNYSMNGFDKACEEFERK